MSFIRKLPLPLAAVALALATLGNLLLSYSPLIRLYCGLISAILLAGVTLRLLLDTKAVRRDLDNVLVYSTLPTYFMASMTLSTYIAPALPQVAFIWWSTAFISQIALVLCFSWRYLRAFKIETVSPGWFVTYVGFVVAGITSPVYGLKVALGQPIFYLGLLGYLLMLLVVCYRVFVVGQLPDPAKPSLAIFMAPANLCLVGYLAVFEQRNSIIVTLLLTLSCLSALGFLLYLPRVLRLPFFPSYAGLTFPFVILALALKQTNAAGLIMSPGTLAPLVLIAELVATLMVTYVLGRYLLFLFPDLTRKASDG